MVFVWILLQTLFSTLSNDAQALPYTQRTSRFSAYSTSLKGDLTHLGLAGASAALGDQFIGSLENPAALAMTARSGGLQISGNDIQDGFLQDYGRQLTAYHYGAHVSEYPWGISAGVWSPHHEGDDAASQFENQSREYRLSLSRVLKNHRWSVGASLIVGDSRLKSGNESANSQTLGYSVGVVHQFKPRQLLGLSLTSPMTFDGEPTKSSPLLPGFFQGAHAPLRIQAGYGWIPNRIFRVGLGLSALGTSPNTALLSDQNARIGEKWSLHPRAGFQITLVDFKEFWVRVGGGSYLESSRISGRQDRIHFTGTVEITAWILSFGWGLDSSKQYRNLIYSGGIDVVRLLQKIDLIPSPTHYPSQGILPNPARNSDEGLARPLVKDWVEPEAGKSVIEIGRELPGKVQDKVKTIKNEVLEAVKPRAKQYDSAPVFQKTPKKKKSLKKKGPKKN